MALLLPPVCLMPCQLATGRQSRSKYLGTPSNRPLKRKRIVRKTTRKIRPARIGIYWDQTPLEPLKSADKPISPPETASLLTPLNAASGGADESGDRDSSTVTWVPVPELSFSSIARIAPAQFPDLWYKKYPFPFTDQGGYARQFEYWYRNQSLQRPCCIFGESENGAAAILQKGLTRVQTISVELDICNLDSAVSCDQLLRSALQTVSLGNPLLIIRVAPGSGLEGALMKYLTTYIQQPHLFNPLVLLMTNFDQYLRYKRGCYGMVIQSQPNYKSLTTFAEAVLTAEKKTMANLDRYVYGCRGNPTRLMNDLQWASLVQTITPSKAESMASVPDNAQTALEALLLGSLSLSERVTFIQAHYSRLQPDLFDQYLEQVPGDWVPDFSDLISLSDILPSEFGAVCLGLGLPGVRRQGRIQRKTQWNPTTRWSSTPNPLLKLSCLIKGGGVLELLEGMDLLACRLQSPPVGNLNLFTRDYQHPPFVYDNSGKDGWIDLPLMQASLLQSLPGFIRTKT